MTLIQVRRGTAAAWEAANPVLAQGEIGYEVDDHGIKVGDGSTHWNTLSYFPVSWSALIGRPTVIAAAETAADARDTIDAEYTGNKAAANGYASLDANAKVPAAQLPNSIMEYQGTWNATTNSPTLADGDAAVNTGSVYRVATGGTHNFGSGAITFNVGDYCIYNGTAWEKSDTTDAVSTVAGRTGDVTIAWSDLAASTSAAVGVGSIELGHASDTTITRSAAGKIAVEGTDVVLSNGSVSGCTGQVADMSIVAFGANTARATGTGDFPFGVKLQRAITFTSVTFRAATADASGNLVVELQKNGSQVSGTPTTIAYGSQVSGGTSTGTWAFAAGDILTVNVTGVGGTPGKGLVADVKGMTA